MLPLKVKCVSEVAILKSLRSSRLVNFISGLFSKIKLIAISIASDNRILYGWDEKSSKTAKSEVKIRYFMLPFIGLHSKLIQNKIDQLCKRFCKRLKVKLVLTSEKLRCAFSTKDPYQSEHLSKVVYKFVCASCNASYVSQTCRHLATRIDEHFGKDKKSHIYQHLMSSKDCLNKKLFKKLFFCFRYRQHRASIKNKRLPIHHMVETHFK